MTRRTVHARAGVPTTRSVRALLAAVLVALLAACAVGPDYRRPDVPTPAQWSNDPPVASAKPAEPADTLAREGWWRAYGDPVLDALVPRIDAGNFSLQSSYARVRQAQALTAQARAAYVPTVNATLAPTRSRSSSALGTSTTIPGRTITRYALSSDVSWEADLWGRVSRGVESATASEQAARADVESARLALQVQLVQDYLLLRVSDVQSRLYEETVAGFARSVELTENRYRAGVAARADVVQAQAQLESARAQAVDLAVQRGQLEHAIAVLTGQAPGAIRIARADRVPPVPDIPVGLPSALLERRPDVAGAERRIAAANAQIGVTKAAWFPSLTLSASAGVQSTDFAHWLELPARFWTLGPALAQTLFDGGLRRARTEQAIAQYDQAVADYRGTVLTAFQQVEDALVALRVLEQEALIQQRAVEAAVRSVELVQNQYRAGLVSYLNVVTAQATALAEQRNALQLAGRRLASSASLVSALGGGWQGPP